MSGQREPVPDYVVEFLDAVGRLAQAAAGYARQQPRPAVELTGAVNIGFQASGDLTVTSAPATAPAITPPVHAVFATESGLAVDDAGGVEVIAAAVSSIGTPLIEQVRAWLQAVAREHPFLAGALPAGVVVNVASKAIEDPVNALLREIMELAALVIYYLSQ